MAERILSHSSICEEYFVLSLVAMETLCQPDGPVMTSGHLSCDFLNWTTKMQCIWALQAIHLACYGIIRPSALFSGSLYEFEPSLQFGSHLSLLQGIEWHGPTVCKKLTRVQRTSLWSRASLLQRIRNNTPGANENRKPFSPRPLQSYSAIPPAQIPPTGMTCRMLTSFWRAISNRSSLKNHRLEMAASYSKYLLLVHNHHIPLSATRTIFFRMDWQSAARWASSPHGLQRQTSAQWQHQAAVAAGLIWPRELSSQWWRRNSSEWVCCQV